MVIAAILLAATDTKIGGVPLALLPWVEGDTLVEYHIAQLRTAGVDVIEVVLGYDAERIIPLVARNDVEPIVDAHWQTGEASWLRVGAAAVPRDTQAAIILRVDEPRPADIPRQLLDEHLRTRAEITRASYKPLGGAPIVVTRAVLEELRNATDERGRDAVLARHASESVDVAFDERVLLRIKTAEDYEAARRALG